MGSRKSSMKKLGPSARYWTTLVRSIRPLSRHGAVSNFNLWGLDHVFSAQYTTSVDDASKISVYGAGYHVPLYASATPWTLRQLFELNAGQCRGLGRSAGQWRRHHVWRALQYGLPRIGHYDSQ